jgi:hypothetical protein
LAESGNSQGTNDFEAVEGNTGIGIRATSTVTAELTVEKGQSVPMRGYFNAVERAKHAIARGLIDEVYISVTEALQRLTALAGKT